MMRKKPENRYPYINPLTAQCAGASIGRSGSVAVSVAATADPVAAQGHPEVVNAVMQVMMTILHFNLRNYPFRNLFRPAHPPAF